MAAPRVSAVLRSLAPDAVVLSDELEALNRAKALRELQAKSAAAGSACPGWPLPHLLSRAGSPFLCSFRAELLMGDVLKCGVCIGNACVCEFTCPCLRAGGLKSKSSADRQKARASYLRLQATLRDVCGEGLSEEELLESCGWLFRTLCAGGTPASHRAEVEQQLGSVTDVQWQTLIDVTSTCV